MWDKLGAVVGLVMGCIFLIFRKRFVNLTIRKQLEKRATPKMKEYHQQLEEMKLEGILYKFLEIALIVFGVLWLLVSIHEFFPQTQKYVGGFLKFFSLSLFAAGAAALVELILIFRFLWRNVRKYIQERDNLSWNAQNYSGSDRLNAVSAGSTDDPVLRGLQRKAIVYTIVCFVPLFVIFLFAFYTIIRITS